MWIDWLVGNSKKFQRLNKLKEEKPSIIKNIWQEMIRRKVVIFALIYLSIFFLAGIIAIFAGFFDLSITPYGYEEIDYEAVRQGPSFAHWFGTDLIGRDMFTRIFFSIGTSVELAVLVVLFGGLIVGVTLGLIAGYFGGLIDWIIMRVGEIFATMPAFFMFLYLTLSFRSKYDEFFYSLGDMGEWLIKEGIVDFSMIFIVFSVFFWVGSARIIRSQVLTLREMPYIDAARVLGASSFRIIVRHIFPNLLGIIVLWMFSALGSVVLLEVGLSFFGLGIRPPHPSFGVLLSENISSIRLLDAHPHLLIFPGVLISLFILSFAFLEINLNDIISRLYKKGGNEK